MSRFSIVLLSSVIVAMTGCVSLPNAPAVMVLPGTGIVFEKFRNDDVACQQYASYQIASSNISAYELQQRYDVAYVQCMYAKGHQVPVSGQFSGVVSSHPAVPTANIPPPPAGMPPPPPPKFKCENNL